MFTSLPSSSLLLHLTATVCQPGEQCKTVEKTCITSPVCSLTPLAVDIFCHYQFATLWPHDCIWVHVDLKQNGKPLIKTTVPLVVKNSAGYLSLIICCLTTRAANYVELTTKLLLDETNNTSFLGKS